MLESGISNPTKIYEFLTIHVVNFINVVVITNVVKFIYEFHTFHVVNSSKYSRYVIIKESQY